MSQNTETLEIFRLFPLIHKVFLLHISSLTSNSWTQGVLGLEKTLRTFYDIYKMEDEERANGKGRATYKVRGQSAWLEGAFTPSGDLWLVLETLYLHGHLLSLPSQGVMTPAPWLSPGMYEQLSRVSSFSWASGPRLLPSNRDSAFSFLFISDFVFWGIYLSVKFLRMVQPQQELFKTQPDSLAFPAPLHLSGKHLFILKNHMSPTFHLYDMENPTLGSTSLPNDLPFT